MRRMASGWQIYRILRLPSIKMSRKHFCLPNHLTDQTTTPTNERRKRRIRTRAKHSRLQGGPPLMGTLGFYQTIQASDTILTPSLGIYYISAHLVMDKLIEVNSRAITSPPRMSLPLEVERMPAVIIKPRLILVTHTDHRSRNNTLN